MKVVVEEAFTGGSEKNFLTDGNFLTYCQNGPEDIVFLCHVPSLRSFKSKETKEALAEIAWIAALQAAETLDPEGGKTLLVGLRGIVMYGSIQEGANQEEAKPKARSTSDETIFYRAFAPVKEEAVDSGERLAPEHEG